MDTLQAALNAYSGHAKMGLATIQREYNELVRNKTNSERLSYLSGRIYGMAVYEHYFDQIYDQFTFVSKKTVEDQYGVVLTDAEFEEWMVEQKDWFFEEKCLPDRANDLTRLMMTLERSLTGQMNNKSFMDGALNEARRDNPGVNSVEFIKGLEDFMGWVKKDVIPALGLPKDGLVSQEIIFFKPSQFHH